MYQSHYIIQIPLYALIALYALLSLYDVSKSLNYV